MSARIDGAMQLQPLHRAPPHVASGAGFAQALQRTLDEIDRSGTAGAVAKASDLDTRAALDLQAAVYLHVERLELVSKLLDHGVGAIKTVLQTRV